MTERADRAARIRALAEKLISRHRHAIDGEQGASSLWRDASTMLDDFDRLEAEERAKGGGDE